MRNTCVKFLCVSRFIKVLSNAVRTGEDVVVFAVACCVISGKEYLMA